jgi:hypothetical protein
VEFGPMGMEVEIFAYVLTDDVPSFLAIREELLLQAIALVEGAGARFAENAAWPPGTLLPAEDPPR